jgi:hypothetical protein
MRHHALARRYGHAHGGSYQIATERLRKRIWDVLDRLIAHGELPPRPASWDSLTFKEAGRKVAQETGLNVRSPDIRIAIELYIEYAA